MSRTPRPYQTKMATSLLAYVQRGVPGAIGVLPTGAGKTDVGMMVARTVVEAGHSAIWLTHRLELIRQASKRAELFGIPHGIITPDAPFVDAPFQIASIDTVRTRLGTMAPLLRRMRTATFDEAHHIVADGWRSVADAMPAATNIGLTATPYRLDGRGLGDDGAFTHLAEGPGIRDLIDQGYLAPFAVYVPSVALNLSGIRRVGGDHARGELSRRVNTDELRRAAIRSYARICPGARAAVFCVDVQHARDMADAFTAAGWSAASVDGSMSTDERDGIITGLETGRYQLVTSCNLISEGWDVPGLEAVILARPTRATALYQQQCGRASRTAPGKLAGTIIDLAGAVAEHGLPDEKRPFSLTGGLKGIERSAIQAVRRCQRCMLACRKGPTRCPGCGRPYGIPMAGGDVRVAMLPGIAGMSADRIATLRFDVIVPLIQSPDDLLRVAAIKSYPPEWVREFSARRGWSGPQQQKRFG